MSKEYFAELAHALRSDNITLDEEKNEGAPLIVDGQSIGILTSRHGARQKIVAQI